MFGRGPKIRSIDELAAAIEAAASAKDLDRLAKPAAALLKKADEESRFLVGSTFIEVVGGLSARDRVLAPHLAGAFGVPDESWAPEALAQAAAELGAEAERDGAEREQVAAIYGHAANEYARALGLVPDRPSALYGRGFALFRAACNEPWPPRRALLVDAERALGACLRYDPDAAGAEYHRAEALAMLAQLPREPDPESVAREAADAMDRAVRRDPDLATPRQRLGVVLRSLANLIEEPERAERFEAAAEAGRDAAAMEPDIPEHQFELGVTLRYASDASDSPDRERLLAEAIDAFERATDLEPDNAGLWSYRARALADLGRMNEPGAAAPLLDEAAACFRRALESDPGEDDAAFASSELGRTLYDLARVTAGDGAVPLLREAVERHDAAAAIRPGVPWPLVGAGDALTALTSFEQDERAGRAALREAMRRYHDADAANPGDASIKIRLAGAWAIAGDADNALRRLREWRDLSATASRAELDRSPWLDRIQAHPEFIAFRDELPDAV